MITAVPPRISLPRRNVVSSAGAAAANRALAKFTEELAERISLTPRYLQYVTAEPLLGTRRPLPEFSLGQAEAAVTALRFVNSAVAHALHWHGEDDLPGILATVTRTVAPEIHLLAARYPLLPERHALCLYQSAALTLTLQTWDPGKWTTWHDHSCARLAFQVVEGHLYEMRYEGGVVTTYRRTSGRVYTGDPAAPHRVGDGAGVSLHAYAPYLEKMTRFAETPSGDLAFASGRPVVLPDGANAGEAADSRR